MILFAIERDGNTLSFASVNLPKDNDIVLTAVNKKAKALLYAGKCLTDDWDFVREAVKQNKDAINYAQKKYSEIKKFSFTHWKEKDGSWKREKFLLIRLLI